MNSNMMMSLAAAHANVDALRNEARMSRGHDGVPTMDFFRSITGRSAR